MSRVGGPRMEKVRGYGGQWTPGGNGAWVRRAAWTRRVDAPRGVNEVHAEIWAPFPRMARGNGAPRGRRVEKVP